MRRIARRFLCDKPVKWLLCLHEQTFDGQRTASGFAVSCPRYRVDRIGGFPYPIEAGFYNRGCDKMNAVDSGYLFYRQEFLRRINT